MTFTRNQVGMGLEGSIGVFNVDKGVIPREERASSKLQGKKGLVSPRTLSLRELGLGREWGVWPGGVLGLGRACSLSRSLGLWKHREVFRRKRKLDYVHES